MSILYFIRHAQASFGADDYDRLSELGRRQGAVLGDWLNSLGLTFDAVYSGSLERQRDTAALVLAAMPDPSRPPVQVLPEFNEYDSDGIFRHYLDDIIKLEPDAADLAARMTNDRRAFQKLFERIMNRWVSGRHGIEGLESWTDYAGRIEAGIKRVMAETGRKKTVAVVSSGGPLAVLVGLDLGLTPEKTIQVNWQVKNASISTFFYNNERLTLSSFNSVAHLEVRGEPELITYR